MLLGNLTFVEVRNWQKGSEDPTAGVGGKVQLLPNAGLTELPGCWAIIIPELSHTRGVEVLIGVGETILRLDEIEVVDQVRFFGLFALRLSLACSQTYFCFPP